jgi:hypothetical protein
MTDAASGAGFEQVVELTCYPVDATQLPVVREVRDDLLIEVEAVAVVASFQPTTATA